MVKIILRNNGPFLVEGEDVTVVDAKGNAYPVLQRPFGLCRCGASANKPFCDGSHLRIGFKSNDSSPCAKEENT